MKWDFPFISNQIISILDEIDCDQYESVTLFGYSMGGRVALYTLISNSQYFDKAVIMSATAGISSQDDRLKRTEIDSVRGESLAADHEGFVNHWEKLPLFDTAVNLSDSQKAFQRKVRLSHDPSGLKKALSDYGTGNMPDLWPQLRYIEVPVLLLTGTKDTKFIELMNRMHEAIPVSIHHKVEAGHTIHVEHPDIFDTIILAFIRGGLS